MDLAKLSDSELDAQIAALKGGGAPAAPVDPTKLSDQELDAQIAKLSGKKPAPPVLQEMHPDLTAADRLVVKNFSNNNEAAVNYLQKRHPDLEIKVDDKSNQVMARKRDGSELSYRVLDPDTGFHPFKNPKEALQDIGDLGYDVVSGIGTGLATAAGGAAGAVAGPAGALGAGAAAGGAASGGLETLKQGIGKALGVGDWDGTDIGIATGAGAVSPLLFGTGASAGQIAKQGLTGDAAQAALKSQRGLLGYGWDAAKEKVLPWVGEKVSGISGDALRTLGSKYDDLVKLEKDPMAITNMTEKAASDVGSKLRTAKKDSWEIFSKSLGKAGDEKIVNLSDVVQPFKTAMADAKAVADETGSEASSELYKALSQQFGKFFKSGDDEIVALSPKSAAKLEQQLADLADFQAIRPDATDIGNRFAASSSAAEKELMTLAAQMKQALKGKLDEVLPEGAMAARNQYGELANLERRTQSLLKNPKAAFASLRNADKIARTTDAELFNQLDKRLGSNLIEDAKLAQTYATFARPSGAPLSGMGSTSTSRSIPLAAAGGAAGYYLGSRAGGEGHGSGVLGAGIGGAIGAGLGSPTALRAMIKAGLTGQKASAGLQKAVGNNFGPQQAVSKELLQNTWMKMKDKEKK